MNELQFEKIMYQRLGAIVDDAMLTSIVRSYGYEPLRRSCVLEGFEPFIKANAFKGKTCIEIGTCSGLTALVLSRYFDRVISIDIMDNHWKHDFKEEFCADNVEFVTVANNAEKYATINNAVFDAAFVDGDHANDTDSDFAAVRRCGTVLFHEYWDAQPPVKNLVDELAQSGNVAVNGKFAIWRGVG